MKNLCLALVLSLISSFAIGQKAVEVSFEKEMISLGKVNKGDKKTLVYHFTNTGKDDIEIELVTSCVCTTLDWTRGKIKSGDKGTITAVFDSSQKEASETISVEMYLTNIDPRIDANYLYIVEYDYELVK